MLRIAEVQFPLIDLTNLIEDLLCTAFHSTQKSYYAAQYSVDVCFYLAPKKRSRTLESILNVQRPIKRNQRA